MACSREVGSFDNADYRVALFGKFYSEINRPQKSHASPQIVVDAALSAT
jgi:hypothetical protein